MKPENLLVHQKGDKGKDAKGLLLAAVFSPVIILLVAHHALSKFILNALVWVKWCLRGKFILFVWSDSPIWREYIQQNILPQIEHCSIILNWSQRKQWRWWSLPVSVFLFFGGSQEFNPMAVVFRPFHCTRVFRFWYPFKDFKHGKKKVLIEMTQELMKEIDRP